MRNWIRRARVGEKGQALVELAFVIPLVLLFLFGIIDFGLALNQQNGETNIANIAVREAAIVGTSTTETCGTTVETSLSAWTMCESSNSAGPNLASVCVYDTLTSTTGTVYNQGDPVEVKVAAPFSWLKLLTGVSGALTTTIGASATMREEGSITSSTNPFFTNTSITC